MKWVNTFLILLFWLGVWQLGSIWIAHDVLLVSPIKAFARLLVLAGQWDFWYSIGISLGRIMLGFFLALLTAVVLSLVSAKFAWVHTFLTPLMSVIKATPVASFIILALVWVKSANLSTFASFVMVLPMIYTNLYQGITSVSTELLEVGRVFGMSHWTIMRRIYFPSVVPYLVSSCTVGLGFAWKSGVAAEVIGLPNHTIGMHLYDAKVYLEMPDVFAWTIVIVALSVLMEKLVLWGIKMLNRKIRITY